MIRLLAYPLTLVYFLFFGLSLLIFHPIQWFCFNVFGYQAHKKSVDYLNFCLMRCLHILGVRYSWTFHQKLNRNQPTIIVSNHQSMNDIPPIIWCLRKLHPKFISKKELGKGIPSVSYNLRHGGSVLIDRKDAAQSIKAIAEFAENVEQNNWGAVIFPEGTRSRDGNPKPFKRKGLQTMIEKIPSAVVLPITIENSWKTLKYGKFPMGLGAHMKYTVHPVMKYDGQNMNDFLDQIEQTITKPLIDAKQ